MNKDEIKKALVQCSDFVYCGDCPYFNRENRRCRDKLQRDARDLITEQEKEIERLKAENEELTKVVSSKVYDLIDNTKEIADAREAWEQQAKIDVLNELKGRLGQVKIDDTKIKFWKVTDMSGTLEQAPIDYKPVNIIIDELIKEIKK